MLRRIVAALRGDRGEASAVSVIIGTLLFLASSAGVVAVIGPTLSTTGATRQSAIIESALQARVQTFQTTPWMGLAAAAAATSTTTSNGVTFPLTSAVTVTANPTVYTLRVAAPAVTSNTSVPNCSTAVTTVVPGCLSLSSVRIASIQEQQLLTAVPGFTTGPNTVNAAQHALDIITVNPATVTFTDPARIQVLWNSTTDSPYSVNYGFFCGANTAPQATFTANTMITGTTVSLILQLTPFSLQSVGGCTSATIGLWTSGAAVPVADATVTGYWRVTSATGGTP